MLRGDPRQKFAEGKALEVLADKIGVSPETLRQALYVGDMIEKLKFASITR